MGDKEFKNEIKKALITWTGIIFLLGLISLMIDVVTDFGLQFFLLASSLPTWAIANEIFRIYVERKTVRDSVPKNNIYVREIPKEIPPAIASLLIDNYLENNQDYLATIANLIAKGYIEVKVKEKNEYGLIRPKIEVKKDFIYDLMEHEKFAFRCFCERHPFDEEEFKKKILRDAQTLKLIQPIKDKKKSEKMYWKNVAIIILCIILMITGLYGGFWCWVSIEGNPSWIWYIVALLEIVLVFVINQSKAKINVAERQRRNPDVKFSYEKTELGKEYTTKFWGLKNYLHEYTLIEDKNLDSVALYDEYIAYAISLEEADKLEKLVTDDYNLRNILLKIQD